MNKFDNCKILIGGDPDLNTKIKEVNESIEVINEFIEKF